MQKLGKDDVIISKGFAANLEGANAHNVGLGAGRGGDISANVAGVVYLLPGLSQFQIQDRESFSSASVDFINSIIQTQPYVVGRLDSDKIAGTNGFLARVVVHMDGGNPKLLDELRQLQSQGLIPPVAAINTQDGEKDRLASDMFIYLALENIKVFMIGGMLVALAGLIAITIVNFNESKRLFALLRLRGASPNQLMRVVLADLVAPLSVGACIGIPVGLVTGYGLTNAIFALPRAASILQILPVHLTLGWLVAAIIGGVFVFFLLSSYGLSSWVFRKTAREALGQ
jgi:ABC-type antimicrobial peptide transport system permease subunit